MATKFHDVAIGLVEKLAKLETMNDMEREKK